MAIVLSSWADRPHPKNQNRARARTRTHLGPAAEAMYSLFASCAKAVRSIFLLFCAGTRLSASSRGLAHRGRATCTRGGRVGPDRVVGGAWCRNATEADVDEDARLKHRI